MSQDVAGVQIDVHLRSVVINYANDRFVAEQGLFRPVYTPAYAGKYRKVGGTRYLVENAGPLAHDAPAERIDQASTQEPYLLKKYGLYTFVGTQLEDRSLGAYRLREEASMDLTERLMMVKEQAAKTLAEADASFGSTTTPTNKWSDYGTGGGNPVEDILEVRETIRKQVGTYPTHCQMSASVWTKVKQNPKVRNLLGDNTAGNVTLDMFSDFVEIDNIIVAGNIYNKEPEGIDADYDDVWGNFCQVVVNQSGRNSMRWGGSFQPQQANKRWQVRRWPEMNPPGENIIAESYYQLKVIEKDAGVLIKAPIA